MSPLKISVLLPVYNEEKYLHQCIDSILAQTDTTFEICISDNASTDGTWGIIRTYMKRGAPIVAYRHPSLIHPHDNFIQTYRMATGDLFYYMGGDDFLVPGMFRECLQAFASSPKLIAYLTGTIYFDDSTGAALTTLPPIGFDDRINQPNDDFIRFILNQINHDELTLSVFRKSQFASAVQLTSAYSYEPVGTLFFLIAALGAEDPQQRVKMASRPYLMKRNFKKLSYYSQTINEVHGVFRQYCWMWIGSILTVFRLKSRGLISASNAILLLVRSRYSTDKYTPDDPTVSWQCFGPILGLILNTPVWIGRKVLGRIHRFVHKCHVWIERA